MNRVLSIDYGDKRVGLALSDSLKIIAKPFKTIVFKNQEDLIMQINEIINSNNVEKIVVGLPLTLKGTYSEQTKKVLSFIDILKSKVAITIDTYDERLSSIEAKKSLISQGVKTGHSKEEVDKTAAAIFLQSYLDKHGSTK